MWITVNEMELTIKEQENKMCKGMWWEGMIVHQTIKNYKKYLESIIRGKRKFKFLEPHTIVTAKKEWRGYNGFKHPDRTAQLIDTLYDIYRKDPLATPGVCQMPWYNTLGDHKDSEFHIYSQGGIPVGWFASFIQEWGDLDYKTPNMTFVWVVPRFRRMGVFTKMHKDLCEHRGGPVIVDQPNKACEMALDKIGYKRDEVFDFHEMALDRSKD